MFSLSAKSISCPVCSHPSRLTHSSVMQALELGVFCECQKCSHEWVFNMESQDELNNLSQHIHEDNPLVLINISDRESCETIEAIVKDEGIECVCGCFDINEIIKLDRTRLGCLIQNVDDLKSTEECDIYDRLFSSCFVRVIVYSHRHDLSRIGRFLQRGAFDFQRDLIGLDRLRLRLHQAIVETQRRREVNFVMTSPLGIGSSEVSTAIRETN